MKIAFMFPGQGAQTVGMGKDLYDKYEEIREVYKKASEISGKDIAELTFNSTMEELSKTENTQLAIATMSLGILKVLENNGINPEITVGLSLGEYPALISGGYLSFEDGITLLKHRGYLMGNKVEPGNYSMAAIIGLDSKIIEEVCSEIAAKGIFISPANYNYSGQTVISGEVKALEASAKIAKELGGRALPLKVSGPFHCSMYKDASYKFYEEVKKAEINDFKKVVYSNVKGAPYKKDDDIKELLRQQIMSPVLFEKSIRDLINKGVDTFIEVGPGKALSGFVKKIDKSVKIYNVCDIDSLESTISNLEL